MAFSTQFSYDSPIQVLTCSSSSVLKPVSRWTSRFSQCSKKLLLVTALVTICFVVYLLLKGGKASISSTVGQQQHPVPSAVSQQHCDARLPGADCGGGAHPVTSSLQKFLKESSTRDHSLAEQHRTKQEEGGSEVTTDGQDGRNYRPRIATVHGQYEGDHDQQHLSGPPATKNSTQRAHGPHNPKALSSEDLQAVREGLARAKRSVVPEGREAPQAIQGNIQQPSMRVVEEEPLTRSQYEANRHQAQYGAHRQDSQQDARKFQPQYEVYRRPEPQYDTNRHSQTQYDVNNRPNPQHEVNRQASMHDEATNQFQPQYDATRHTQADLEANNQPQLRYDDPQLRYDSNRPSQLHDSTSQHQNPEEVSKQYMPEEARQSQLGQHSPHQDQSQSLAEDSQRQYVPEEAQQAHYGQPPSENEAITQPQLQEDSIGQDHGSPVDLEKQYNPEKSHQEMLDQLYIQQINLERNNYLKEQQIVEKEIEEREKLQRRHQEELWQDQRRQTHNRSPREQHKAPPQHDRTPQNQQEQWVAGRSHHEAAPQREEFIPYDERHPAWRDQRLPRGVNPKRYYMHADL